MSNPPESNPSDISRNDIDIYLAKFDEIIEDTSYITSNLKELSEPLNQPHLIKFMTDRAQSFIDNTSHIEDRQDQTALAAMYLAGGLFTYNIFKDIKTTIKQISQDEIDSFYSLLESFENNGQNEVQNSSYYGIIFNQMGKKFPNIDITLRSLTAIIGEPAEQIAFAQGYFDIASLFLHR